ncbi:MAG: hypothetical protein LBT58_02045 [Endomicrobium sp.]|jgi:hypothetical protein|nr:hypothetical protein [Endomicrobium sp.]
MTNENNKNAHAGRNIEIAIKNSIVNNPSVIKKIREKYNIRGEFDSAAVSGVYGEKADLRIAFSCGHYVDANIKGYKEKSGFNQLARSSVSKFCQDFGLGGKKEKDLKNIMVAKSRNIKNSLFSEKAQRRWAKFFKTQAKKILFWSLSYKPSREILVIYNRDTSIVKIYPMKEILGKLPATIAFTKGGFNIGDCVSFQRKGGNGSMSRTISKTSIKHPGNNIQMKLKIRKTIELLEDIKLAEYTI